MLVSEGKAVDVVENPLGIRKVELTHERGLLLNGKPVKMIGTNRHQHYGYIGDAMPNALHYKDVLQIKKLGMNTLRTAHYPHDDAILNACDRLGILVYEEAPTWIDIENEAWFDNFEKAARTMVRNHRNHPSVIIWGAGINHRGYVPRAQYAIKQEDPTRLTASQSSRWTGWQTSGLTDIYAQMVYGEYYWSEDEYVLAMEGGRGPGGVNEVMDHPMKLGIISWTAHAYYTFHIKGNAEDRTRSGMMTVFRYPRPNLAWYPSEMLEDTYLHIRDSWKEGIEELTVYSNAEELRILVNGKEAASGLKPMRDRYPNIKHPPFEWKVDSFEPGELTVEAYRSGKMIATSSIQTPGKPHHIVLSLDTEGRIFTADGSDILVAYARVVDKNGTTVDDTDIRVEFSVEGPAYLVGDGLDIKSNPAKCDYGVAPALIRAGTEAGQIIVTAKAKRLKPASVTIGTVPSKTVMVMKEARPIYDFDKIRVDIGEHKQLVQFDWIPWNADDNTSSVKEFKALGGFEASLAAAKEEKLLRWLGEINVMGKYGYAFGEGVLCMDKDGLVLEFRGLKKGKYRLTTWHHAPRSGTDSMDPNQELQVTAQIFKLPYASKLNIRLEDAKGIRDYKTDVTFGKAMHNDPFGSATCVFESDGVKPVRLHFRDPSAEKGIWLNAFELGRWFE